MYDTVQHGMITGLEKARIPTKYLREGIKHYRDRSSEYWEALQRPCITTLH